MTKNAKIDVEVNTSSAKNSLRELASETTRINQQVNNQSSKENKETQTSLPQHDRFLTPQERASNKSQIQEFRENQSNVEGGLCSCSQEFEKLIVIQSKALEVLEKILSMQGLESKGTTIENQRSNDEFRAPSTDSPRGAGGGDNNVRNEPRQSRGTNGKSKTGLIGGGFNAIGAVGNFVGDVERDDTSGGLAAAGGMISKIGPIGYAIAGIGAAITGAIMLANNRDKTASNLTSYRALGDKEQIKRDIEETDYVQLGLNAEDLSNKRKELLLASGRGASGGIENTLNTVGLEKGYGIENVSALSANERADKYGKTTSDNIVEMLNVLSQIRDGSIKPNDLTLANEKANLMFRLQTSQVSREEKFDQKSVLGLMTAFEKMGGEGKDQRAGDFIEGMQRGLGEGGNANIRLLKTQFAMQAHPELADDPYAISRIIEEGNDPKYQVAAMKGIVDIGGGQKSQNTQFLMKEFFKGSGLTASMRDKLMKSVDNPDIMNSWLGKNLGAGSGIDKPFSTEDAKEYAKSKVTVTDELLGDISKKIGSISDWLVNFTPFGSKQTPTIPTPTTNTVPKK